jgi:hypothetical protein
VTKKSATLALATTAALLALAVVPTTFAAKGGQAGRGPGSTPSATLETSCNPSCPAGSYATFWGEGYDGSQGAAQLYVSGTWTGIAVNADGTVSFTWYMSAQGTYDFRVYQRSNGRKMVLKAQLAVTAT